MSLADIRTAMKTMLEAITPSIGSVHEYERWTIDPATFLLAFKDPITGVIRAWMITRESTEEEILDVGGLTGNNLRRHQMLIKGYWGLQDPTGSEKSFQDAVERICTTFRPDATTTPLAPYVVGVSGPPQVRTVGHVQLGEILCHYTEIVFQAVELTVR